MKIFRKIILIWVSVLILCCTTNRNKEESFYQKEEALNQEEVGIQSIDSLIGRDLSVIIKAYGNPNDSSIIYISEGSDLLEYQLDILNKVKDRNVFVKEYKWQFKNKRMVVWVKKENEILKIVDVLIYGKHIKF